MLVDPDGKVQVFMPGRPDDPTWDENMVQFDKVVDEVAALMPEETAGDRRGSFNRIKMGNSYGGGQKVRNVECRSAVLQSDRA